MFCSEIGILFLSRHYRSRAFFRFWRNNTRARSTRQKSSLRPNGSSRAPTPTDGRFTYPIYCVGFDNRPLPVEMSDCAILYKINRMRKPSVGRGWRPLQPAQARTIKTAAAFAAAVLLFIQLHYSKRNEQLRHHIRRSGSHPTA